MRGYDNSVRPDFGGPPATVEVDIMVRSMGPISEVDMVKKLLIIFKNLPNKLEIITFPKIINNNLNNNIILISLVIKCFEDDLI